MYVPTLQGMSDDWDVYATRKRKQTALYEAGPARARTGGSDATPQRKRRDSKHGIDTAT